MGAGGMVEHALDWARRGFRVFPCDPSPSGENSKRPLLARDKGPDGKPIPLTGWITKATTDEATIRGWWKRWPNAMIGLPMGEAAGVFAIDPDVPKSPGDADGLAAWLDLVAMYGDVPLTHAHASPSGGKHLLFRYPGDRRITNREGNLPAGINVRGEGGYVVAPPSRLLDGRAYRIDDERHAYLFAEPPPWLLDMIEAPRARARTDEARDEPEWRAQAEPPRGERPRTRIHDEAADHEAYVGAALEAECAKVASAARGGRNGTLNTAAFNLGQLVGANLLDASLATRQLLDAARQSRLVQEDGQQAALATIESGLTAGAQQPRAPRERKARSGGPKRTRAERQGPGGGTRDAATEAHPAVRIIAGRVPEAADRMEELLLKGGVDVFARAGTLTRPVIEEVPASHGRVTTVARMRPLCVVGLADIAARRMRFLRFDRRASDWLDVNPPNELMATLLAREGQWRIPTVAGVITTPTLRPDGSILDRPGYDPATRLFLTLDRGFRLPAVPERPSRQEAERAIAFLADLLAGFPFVGRLDRAVALSGILTAVVRGTLPVAPLHAIRAHSPGTGKSFLVDIISLVATGRRCPVIAAGKSEEETEKRLASLLRDAVPVVSIDNVGGDLGGDLLCQMTERPLIRVRILGKSEAPELECRSTIFATGNNMTLVGDMTRRTVLCTLDAGVERPELRAFDFDPIERVLADRGAYVAAALTVIRAYRVAGSPVVCGTVGSYAEWSAAVRAPLIWLGEADPVASMETARDEDPELAAIRELFGHWRTHLGLSSGYTTNAIIQIATEKRSAPSYESHAQDFVVPEFRDLLLRQAGEGGAVNSRRLGRWLTKIGGRVVDGHKLYVKIDGSNGNRFWLLDVSSQAGATRSSAEPVF